MKKPVLIGASLVLATSILGACGKESSTAASGENSNQQIALSQVSNINVNGVQLSEKDVTKYKKEYMLEDTYKKLNRDTQSVIKNMILKEAIMKDLGVSQENIDKQYEMHLKKTAEDPQLTAAPKGYKLHQFLAEAYAKKYLSSDDIIQTLSDSFKGEKKESFDSNAYVIKTDKDKPGTFNLLFNYYNLYLYYRDANKHNEAEILKYQQDLLDKANVKGIKLSNLKADETIF